MNRDQKLPETMQEGEEKIGLKVGNGSSNRLKDHRPQIQPFSATSDERPEVPSFNTLTDDAQIIAPSYNSNSNKVQARAKTLQSVPPPDRNNFGVHVEPRRAVTTSRLPNSGPPVETSRTEPIKNFKAQHGYVPNHIQGRPGGPPQIRGSSGHLDELTRISSTGHLSNGSSHHGSYQEIYYSNTNDPYIITGTGGNYGPRKQSNGNYGQPGPGIEYGANNGEYFDSRNSTKFIPRPGRNAPNGPVLQPFNQPAYQNNAPGWNDYDPRHRKHEIMTPNAALMESVKGLNHYSHGSYFNSSAAPSTASPNPAYNYNAGSIQNLHERSGSGSLFDISYYGEGSPSHRQNGFNRGRPEFSPNSSKNRYTHDIFNPGRKQNSSSNYEISFNNGKPAQGFQNDYMSGPGYDRNKSNSKRNKDLNDVMYHGQQGATLVGEVAEVKSEKSRINRSHSAHHGFGRDESVFDNPAHFEVYKPDARGINSHHGRAPHQNNPAKSKLSAFALPVPPLAPDVFGHNDVSHRVRSGSWHGESIPRGGIPRGQVSGYNPPVVALRRDEIEHVRRDLGAFGFDDRRRPF